MWINKKQPRIGFYITDNQLFMRFFIDKNYPLF
ncbi:hypothetical protein PBAC_12900 [Pedobacter glucosidilyticus]|nr:hypothetical protein PBAC_12900 [Pedobacter glucosidilyticus]